jgi:8-oxo-dGTP diphosphatase
MSIDKISEELIVTALSDGIERFVVGALIKQNDTFLVLQRQSDDFMGGIDELPSGKVENGESLVDALAREVQEEIGLKISKILDYIGHFDYTSGGGKKTRQFNFAVEIASGDVLINPSEHSAFKWVAQQNLASTRLTRIFWYQSSYPSLVRCNLSLA